MRLRIPTIHRRTPEVAPHKRKPAKNPRLQIGKRQKFVIGVLFLSVAQLIVAHGFGRLELAIAPILALLTDVFLLWSILPELTENFTFTVFILPFFYTLAFGLFSFIIPARLMFQLILTLLYALGLYSLYLSQNVFVVAAIRTIALLSGARIVSFVITILTYFFMVDIVLSLHLLFPVELFLLVICTYPLTYQSLWTYSLQRSVHPLPQWAGTLSIIIGEAALLLWFWPSSPTVLALFLTGLLYVLIGLSHVWLDRRLFRGVLWEYVWVGVVVFFVLITFTAWGK
jgi:hypothetical protein